MKKTAERILSAGLIRVNPMHSGCEAFLMQRVNFQGRMNQGRKPNKMRRNSKGARNAEGMSTTVSTQSRSGETAC